MSSRDDVLNTIRANLPRVDRPLPFVPMFDDYAPASLLAAFKENLERMGRVLLEASSSGDPLAPIREKLTKAKVTCSLVPEVAGNRNIDDVQAT
jgi:L-lactate dehydrogenase complex protein LldG